LRGAVRKRFGWDDVLPMPEYLVELLPRLSLLELIRSRPLGGRLIRPLARVTGVNSQVLEALKGCIGG